MLTHYEQLDTESLKQIFSDIYDDSEWLIDLVENLLSISHIENGQMDIHLSLDVVNDVIEEALKHIDKNAAQHHIIVQPSSDVLIARMDARLITQVLINLINNAIKNTQTGSEIIIRCERVDKNIFVHVKDNGPGISDSMKPHIFYGEKCTPVEVAQIGQWAENVYFGKPCGLMDQTASAVGIIIGIDFEDPAKPVVEKIDFDFSACGHALCIIDSGADHADLTDEYAAIPQEMNLFSGDRFCSYQ